MKKRAWIFLIFYLVALLAFPLTSFADDTPSALSLTPPDTDLSVGYLSNIFGVVDGVLAGTGSQLLGTMFAIFNGAVLVLGGIVILYTLFVSTLNTAQEGEVLGKRWSSMWIPLRSVIGIALLIPKASGYSFIQIFMMGVVVQGVGAADSIWNNALDYFLRGGVLIQQNASPSGVGGGGAMMGVSTGLMRSLTCTAGLQRELEDYRKYQLENNINPIPPVPNFLQRINASLNSQLNTADARVYFPSLDSTNTEDQFFMGLRGVCGNVHWTSSNAAAPSGASPAAVQRIVQSRALAVASMVQQLYGSAQAVITNAKASPVINRLPLGGIIGTVANTPVWGAGTLSQPKRYLLPGKTISDAVGTYFGIMAPTLNLINQSSTISGLTTWIQNAKSLGWVVAGRFYFDVIKLNSSISITESSPPNVTVSQNILNSPIVNYFAGGQNSPYVQALSALVDQNYDYTVGPASPFIKDSVTYGNSLTYGNVGLTGGGSGDASSGYDEIDDMLAPVLGIGEYIKTGLLEMASSQSQNKNPVVAIAKLGNGLVGTIFWVYIGVAIAVFVIGLALGIAFGFAFAAAVTGMVLVIMGLLTPILVPLFVVGLTMTFYIPMIPFIIFLFGAIGWFISVIEAIIAAPLVALGIAHPEGTEILGKAEPAVILLVNVFLRPTFMIFGFLIGMMLSYVGIWILNQGFYSAFEGASGETTDVVASLFKPCAYLIIYVLIVMQVVHKSFTLIHVIPDEVLKWIGGNIRGMGGEAEAEGKISSGFSGAAQAQGQSVSKAPDTSQGFIAGVGGAQKEYGKQDDKAEDDQGLQGKESDSKDSTANSTSDDKSVGTGASPSVSMGATPAASPTSAMGSGTAVGGVGGV